MRLYLVSGNEDEYSEAVVADNAKEAKSIAWKKSDWICDACDSYIDLRVKWNKDVTPEQVKELGYGICDDYEELLRVGGFWSVFEMDCPICGTNTTIYSDNGKVGCSKCLYVDEQ